MGQQQQTITNWSCDKIGCNVTTSSYEPSDTPPGWLSLVGAYQDSHGGGPARLDLCPKHARAFTASYILHRDIDDTEDN